VAENDNAQNEGGGALESVKDSAKDVAKDATQTVTSEMKKVAREAAIVVLTPVVKKAATSLTKQLATKGPEFFQDYVEPRIEEAGGVGNLAKELTGSKGLKGMAVGKAAESVMGKVTGKSGGGKADGTGRGRRLPIQEAIDVGVPIDVAYNEWTQFEDFPEFMHRVEEIEQIDDTHLVWHENIWGRRRSWKAEITDQTPNERIAWRSEDGAENVGVVTFHDMGDRLTRILVNLDFQPKGLMEKTASGFRMSRRALRSDLMRFKAHIEMQDEEEGAWRGTVEDGEVTDYDDDYENPRDAGEDDDADDQSDEYEDEQDEDEDEAEQDEDEAEEQSDEYEDDDEEADEDEPEEQSDEYEDDDEEADEDEPEDQSDEYEDDDEEADEDQGVTSGRMRRGRSRARSAAKKSSRPARKRASSAGRAAKKSSSPTRKRASGAAKKTSRTAKKSTGPARKRAAARTAKKTSSTAKKTSAAPSRRRSSTTKKASAAPSRKRTSSGAKKSASTAKKTARKSTGPARKRTSSTTKKASAPARKRATGKRTASSGRRSSR
jgi:uncharacterized membrane protein